MLPWDIAKDRAEELGGHLAICETVEELRYLWNRCGSEPMWIGLSDALVEGQWQWIDGTALDPKLVRSDKSADYVSMLEQGRASDLEIRDYANIMKRWGLLSRANSGLASKYQPSSVPPVQGYIVELEK